MRDVTKEIKILIPMYHFDILRQWAFIKAVPYSQLASNIVQARCEDSHNQKYIQDALETRARQSPHNKTVEALKQEIRGEDSEADKMVIAVERDVFDKLAAIAKTRNKSIEEFLSDL